MMISPEMWYDEYVKGKDKNEQLKILKELDDEIKDLQTKKLPDNILIDPSPEVQISMLKDYRKYLKSKLKGI